MDQLGLEELLSSCLLSDEEYELGSGGWEDFEVRELFHFFPLLLFPHTTHI